MSRRYLASQWALMCLCFLLAKVSDGDVFGIVLGAVALVLATATWVVVYREDRRQVAL